MTPDGIVGVSVNAGPLTPTGNVHNRTHQVSMGPRLHIHIRPEMARQWIEALTDIAEQDTA